MRSEDIAELSARVLLAYYDNDIEPFLDACHPSVLWIGPGEGQIIQTQETLRNTFYAEKNNLTFAVHDLSVTTLPTGSPSVFEVVLMFLVDTFWPNGVSGRVSQRIHLSWVGCKETPRILLCHISNAIAYDERDTIYPLHYDETFRTEVHYETKELPPQTGSACAQKGARRCISTTSTSSMQRATAATRWSIHPTASMRPPSRFRQLPSSTKTCLCAAMQVTWSTRLSSQAFRVFKLNCTTEQSCQSQRRSTRPSERFSSRKCAREAAGNSLGGAAKTPRGPSRALFQHQIGRGVAQPQPTPSSPGTHKKAHLRALNPDRYALAQNVILLAEFS